AVGARQHVHGWRDGRRLRRPAGRRGGAVSASLAIYGGPRAVTASGKERWRALRLRDVAPLAWYATRGINTMPTGGGPIDRFRRRFASRTGSRYALLMNSGTAALHSAFFAIGVKPGDEVIVPPY